MRAFTRHLAALGFGAATLAVAILAVVPVAEAQFWNNWFDDQPRAKPRPVKPTPPPGDDLPPIVPKEESSAPPPPDDRPYDNKLLRLAEILGAVHYLRELCGAQEGQLWREQMLEIVKYEGTTAVRRAKLVNSFNDGYRGYRRTYRSCTTSASLAITRFSEEGAQIASVLAKPQQFVSRTPPDAKPSPQSGQDAKPKAEQEGSVKPDQAKPDQTKPDQTRPDQAKPEQAKADTAKPQTEQTATPGEPAKPPPGRHRGVKPGQAPEPSGW